MMFVWVDLCFDFYKSSLAGCLCLESVHCTWLNSKHYNFKVYIGCYEDLFAPQNKK